MEAIKLKIPFKEDRNYIHGPDLYNAMVQEYQAIDIKGIRFSIHDFIRNQNCILYSTEREEEASVYSSSPVRCTLYVNDKIKYMFIKSDEINIYSEDRIKYEESLILENCIFNENSIINNDNTHYTFIETVVSMNKALLSRNFSDLKGKWIFNKAEMAYTCDAIKDLKLELLQNVGSRIFKTKVFHRIKEIGYIYFSMVST